MPEIFEMSLSSRTRENPLDWVENSGTPESISSDPSLRRSSMVPFRLFLLAALAVSPAAASEIPECGVGLVDVRALATLRATRAATVPETRIAPNAESSTPSFQDGIIVLPANDRIIPFHRPFSLSGRSVRIRRLGPAESRVEQIPFAWNNDLGGVRLINAPNRSTVVTLPFDFPFRDQVIRNIAIGRDNAIWLDGSAPSHDLAQWGELEILSLQEAVISPLLLGARRLGFSEPDLYVRDSDSSAQFTWVAPGSRGYQTQVTLEASGDVIMSWNDVMVPWGSPVISGGAADPFRNDRRVVGETTLPAGDSSIGAGALAAALDMTGVRIERLGESPLLEVRIELSGSPAGTAPADQALQYILAFATGQTPPGSEPFFIANIASDGEVTYLSSPWAQTTGLASARIDGNDIVLSVIDAHLPAGSDMEVLVGTSMTGENDYGDFTVLEIEFEPGRSQESAFSSASGTWREEPLYETFTLGVLDPFAVADALRAVAGDSIDRLDGVAIYQTFLTDIVFFAGAYAYAGNAVANGIGRGELLDRPFEPTLMHMNALGYGHNSTSDGAMRVLLHEFGHRWLYSPSIMVDGEASRILNPISAHPAQYVHTPAAYPVITDRDTSVMGGGWFDVSGTGWITPSHLTYYGYSWVDLYLMGLAGADEVEPSFYIDGTDLGGAYYPPQGAVVSGTQKTVDIESVVHATGTRTPSAAASKRRFRAAVVVIDDPSTPFTDADRVLLDEHRRYVEASFSKATGNRGELSLDYFIPPDGPRRRGVRR